MSRPAGSEHLSVEDLVREHLPLTRYGVAEVAARVPRHVSRDDLESAAMFGLLQAAQSFDPARGIAFERFAMIRIRGALLDELRSRDWASRSVRAEGRRLHEAADRFASRHGRTPTPEETAAELGVDVTRVQRLRDDLHRASVLNYEALATDGSVADVLPDSGGETPEQLLMDREQRAYVMDAICALPERLRHVIVAYFFEERQMQDIATELGVSESRISQMRGEALAMIRCGLETVLSEGDSPAHTATGPEGRRAHKRAAYAHAIATGSDPASRLTSTPAAERLRRTA